MPPSRADAPPHASSSVARVRDLLAAGRQPVPGPTTPPAPDAAPDPVRRRRAAAAATAWTDVLRGRWSLPATAGFAAVVLVAAVAALLVLRAVTTAPAGASGPDPRRATAATPAASATAATAGAGTAGGTARTAGPAVVAVAPGPAAAPSAGPEVVVDVEGHVVHPGLVHLPAGSRVDDAVRAAGGPGASADLTRANLARVLVDGELLVVPAPGDPVATAPAVGAAAAVGRSATPAPQAPVSLSTATASDLDALPGVGPVLAQRILDWRAQHGSFTDVEELGDVSGIGDKLLERLRPLVVV